jgi:hypothetical protein
LIADIALQEGDGDMDPSALYGQFVVDRPRLLRHIRQTLQARSQVTLRELVDGQPLQQGLAELVAYLQLGSESFKAVVDEETADVIAWDATRDGRISRRRARLPRIIFVR